MKPIRLRRVLSTALVGTTLVLMAAFALGATMPPQPGNERQRLVELLAKCRNDPELFNAAILGRKPLWWRQAEIARSVVQNYATVAYTGNMIGKDYLVGTIVPWWLWTRSNSLVVVTGPSQSLLGTVTWKEIRTAIDGSRFPLGAKLSQGAKTSPQVVKLPGHEWQALGYSTTNVERASGQHNAHLLVVIEEASGISPDVMEAVDSLGYLRLLMIGNPIRADGPFIDQIRQAEKDARDGVPPHRRVHAIRIPSTDSPHAALEKSPFGLADRTWLETNARKYGEKSLWYRSHVLAEIPTVSSDQLIPAAHLDFAATVIRQVPAMSPKAGKRRIACDLGEGVGRDSTCILVRDNLGVLEWVVGNTLGLAEAADRIARLKVKWAVEDGDISYDRLGIGKNMPNHLARHGIRNAVGYAGSGTPRDPSQFTNIRTEAAWTLKNRLDPDWCPDPRYPAIKQPPFVIPRDPMLRGELLELTYDLVQKQTRLLSKEHLCERLGHSPDRSDALIQSFAFC